MRIIGLEPTRLAAPDPKSGTSTNFAISAKIVSANIDIIFKFQRAKKQKTKKLDLNSKKSNLLFGIYGLEFSICIFDFYYSN